MAEGISVKEEEILCDLLQLQTFTWNGQTVVWNVCVCARASWTGTKIYLAMKSPIDPLISLLHPATHKNYRFAPPTYFLGLLGRKFGLCVSAGAVCVSRVSPPEEKEKPGGGKEGGNPDFLRLLHEKETGRGSRGREIRLAEYLPTQFPEEGTHKAFLQIS